MADRIPFVNVGNIVITFRGEVMFVTEKLPNRKVYKIVQQDGCYSWMNHSAVKRLFTKLDTIGKLLYA
jgi:hypothetical protein